MKFTVCPCLRGENKLMLCVTIGVSKGGNSSINDCTGSNNNMQEKSLNELCMTQLVKNKKSVVSDSASSVFF